MRHRIGTCAFRAFVFGVAAVCAATAAAQSRQFSFAYDQPPTTAYGIAANIFDAKLKELSGGTMSINQFPGAQLGQEPQMLQKMRAGDIDFVITSTANASTVAPQGACSRCTSSSATRRISRRRSLIRPSRRSSVQW